MFIDTISRKEAYNKAHCWQYDMRIRNFNHDLREAELTNKQIAELSVKDFVFEFVSKEDKEKCKEIKKFVERHEWLGKMPNRPTHRFIATYNGLIAGAIVMATPNSFSNLLGHENRDLEKLISRGACISWSPKNLASALVMFSVRWMVQNTSFRFFTAYSDVEARELGTIYQACNFIYLGQSSGGRREYFDPKNPSRAWFSDRQFRKINQVKRYAKELGSIWQPNWSSSDKVYWGLIPVEVATLVKARATEHTSQCEVRNLTPKHKYVYILGSNKRETEKLKNLFEEKSSKLIGLPYPKYRGPRIDTAAKTNIKKEINLTEVPETSRPQVTAFEFLNVKEVAAMLGVSKWTIYKLIESDQNFPVLNIGVKKKFVINKNEVLSWMDSKTKRRLLAKLNLPSGADLLKLKGEASA